MIGLLRGKLLLSQPPYLLLDVNGVGYEVETPLSTFYALPEAEQSLVLYTHMMVRDDAHILYGFLSEAERGLFRTLLRVNGVGGKMALAILSSMSAEEFALNVQSGDVTALTRIPGVGKKTAERLIIEMRDRVGDFSTAAGGGAGGAPASHTADQDAVSALMALGYSAAEAERRVKKVYQEGMNTEDTIKAALQGAVK